MATFLLVDDALFMRQTLIRLLKANGHETVGEASTGMEGILMYEKVQPDFVLMDITMPDMDGIEATKQIMAKHPEAKIIMVSAMGQASMVLEAIGAGAKDFIVKPFESDKIISCINKWS